MRFVVCVEQLKFVMFNGGRSKGGEILIIKKKEGFKYWNGTQVCKAELKLGRFIN